MKPESWLAALDHELVVRGVGPEQRAEIVVEAEDVLRQQPEIGPLDQFGPPAGYAATVADAVEASGGRPTASSSGGGTIAIEVAEVTKRYRSTTVLAPISFEVSAGAAVALVGPNGAGKSTLLRIVAGLLRADGGRVRVDGSIGYVPQDGGLDPYLRPVEHIELFGTARGMRRSDARRAGLVLAEQLGWDAAAAPLVGELSGGTRQKLSVIVALLGDPDVLLLDEPYQGMDAESSRRFWDLLWSWGEATGGAAVVSTHNADVLDRADAVIEVDIAGATGSALRSSGRAA